MVNSLASPAAIWDKHVKFCVQVDDVLKRSVGQKGWRRPPAPSNGREGDYRRFRVFLSEITC